MNTRAKLVQSIVLTTIGLMALLDALDNPPVQSLRAIDIALLVTAGVAFGAALMTLLAKNPRASWWSSSPS